MDANGGTDGGSNAGSPGGPVPDINSIGGRFLKRSQFVPSRYGQGYWELTVTDTLLGNKEFATVYDAGQLDAEADALANYLLTGNAATLKNVVEARFDVPGAEEKSEGPLENAVEDEVEG